MIVIIGTIAMHDEIDIDLAALIGDAVMSHGIGPAQNAVLFIAVNREDQFDIGAFLIVGEGCDAVTAKRHAQHIGRDIGFADDGQIAGCWSVHSKLL